MSDERIYSITVSGNGEMLFVLYKNGTFDVVTITDFLVEGTLYIDKYFSIDFFPCDKILPMIILWIG